jgi:hypothetical protein
MRRGILGLTLCLIFLIFIFAAPARAAVESELITQGMAALSSAEFEKCVDLISRALAESLTRDEKVAAYRTLGFCHSALDHAKEARAAFVQLLRVDDKAELDRSVAPKVRALFEEARTSLATGEALPPDGSPAEPVLPSLHPEIKPQHAGQGQPISVSVSYPGGSAQELQVFFRSRGQARYQTERSTAQPNGLFSITVPGSEVKAPALELYLTALDGRGVALARAGNFSEPLVIDVTAPPAKKRSRAWVWGVVVPVIAAAGLAVGLGVGLGGSGVNSRSNADVTIIAPR